MKVTSCVRGKFAYKWPRMTRAVLCATLLLLTLCHAKLVSAEIPPLAEKKSVSLDNNRKEEERFFTISCAKCHSLPNPAQTTSGKPDCTKGLSEGDRAQVQTYLADVRKGKNLYESRCGRCHELIVPGSHTREYWSKNVCTSEECFIENLKKDEEQQVLLYLSS